MTITVNGDNLELPTGATVSALLETLKLSGSPCAVEVNEALVPKAKHANRELAAGDVVEIVTLVGGG